MKKSVFILIALFCSTANAKMRPFVIYGLNFGEKVDRSQFTPDKDYKYSFEPKSKIRGFDKYICAITPKSSVPYYVYGVQSSGGEKERVYEIRNALQRSYKCHMIDGFPDAGQLMRFYARVDKSKPNDKLINLELSLSASGMIKVSAFDLSDTIAQEIREHGEELSKIQSIVKDGSVSLDSWLGIPFGKEINTAQFTPSTERVCADMHYNFRPKTQFRDFQKYTVSVTPISRIAWSICCTRDFSSDREALSEYYTTVDIVSKKFSHVPGTDNSVGKSAFWRFVKENHGYERSVHVGYFPSRSGHPATILISASDEDASKLLDKESKQKKYTDADAL